MDFSERIGWRLKLQDLHVQAEIGQKVAPYPQIEKIDRAIQANPVENFDLARVVNVFTAYIQFYEFEVRGNQIQNQSVQLPRSLIASVRDKATRDRITAAFSQSAQAPELRSQVIVRRWCWEPHAPNRRRRWIFWREAADRPHA
jgi:hypothetical protein